MTDDIGEPISGPLAILIGLDFEPAFPDHAFTAETAFEAIRSSMPSLVSHEGNIGKVTNLFLVTPETLEGFIHGIDEQSDSDDGQSDDEQGAQADAEPTDADSQS